MKWNTSKTALICIAVLAVTVTGAAQNPTPYRLTLREAIDKGLQANLSVLVADTRVQEAEGATLRRMSAALLPRVRFQSYANFQNRNLRAFGIPIAGPDVVGPFSNYDFRFSADQNIFDLQSYRNWKASEISVEAGKLDYQDARDLVIRAIASLYLNAQSAAAHVEAVQSRVNRSTALYQLAQNRHEAGVATGVDVVRSQVQLANDKQALLVAQNRYRLALLALARNLGMSPSTPLELSERLQYQELAAAAPADALPRALQARPDYLALASRRQSLIEQQRANQARNYPRLGISGNYGGLGRNIGSAKGTGMIQGQIDFTLFDRDRNGEEQELASRIRRTDEQIADMRRGIEQELQEALLNLESAAAQVAVAREGQDLATRELELAQDRFQSGVANNVEVITAQDELARAQENYIVAVSSHADAKFALARALGGTEKNIGDYLEKP